MSLMELSVREEWSDRMIKVMWVSVVYFPFLQPGKANLISSRYFASVGNECINVQTIWRLSSKNISIAT